MKKRSLSPQKPKPTNVKHASFENVRLFIFFLAFIGLWVAYQLRDRPQHEMAGHPVSYWMEHLSNPAPNASAHAADTLSNVGPETVPALVEALHTQPSKVLDSLQSAAARANIAPDRQYDAANVRATAAYLLGQLGPDAAPAVGDLVLALNDEDPFVRHRARRALFQIHKNSPPELASQIQRALAINGQ